MGEQTAEHVASIDQELADLVQRATHAVEDRRHAADEERTGRVTIPDRPMSGWEVTRLRKRNDNRERWEREG